MLTHIIPQIAPITPPKIISFKSVLLNSKLPSNIENTKNATIVNKIPIPKPVIKPICLFFLSAKKQPISILITLITWLIGFITLSEMFMNLSKKAKISIKTKQIDKEISVPLMSPKKKLPFRSVLTLVFVIVDLFIIPPLQISYADTLLIMKKSSIKLDYFFFCLLDFFGFSSFISTFSSFSLTSAF